VVVIAAYRHAAAARRMVHGLKYHGLGGSIHCLAAAMAHVLPEGTTALVPVRRARIRRWRYGVDPAHELAQAVGRITTTPVIDALRPPLWWPRHAGRRDDHRSPIGFRARVTAAPGWVLVDDVATTGATLDAAAQALEGSWFRALVATSPSRVDRTLVTTDRPASLQRSPADVPAINGPGQAMSRSRSAASNRENPFPVTSAARDSRR
jgi:hypothetical protein